MSSELSSKIIHGISHLALTPAWPMFKTGTWRTHRTSAREKSAYFTFSVKPAALQVLQVEARQNYCWSISFRLGCSSPSFTRTWGNPRRIQISQGFLCSPSLSPPTAWNSLGSEKASPGLPVLLPPVTLPEPAGKCCLKSHIYVSMLTYNVFTLVVTGPKQATKKTSDVSA